MLIGLTYIFQVFSRDIFTCSESTCPESWVGDGICDMMCMNPSCNYDSPASSSIPIEILYSSDCFEKCPCSKSILGNSVCDPDCNNHYCGWDLGDCGYCASGCLKDMLMNDQCDSECSNRECMFDNDNCGWCNNNCFLNDLYSNTCKPECNTNECYRYSTNPCLATGCSEGCSENMLGDHKCDSFCNNADCNYDKHDCDCNTDCGPKELLDSTCIKDSVGRITDPCAVPSCSFKNNACGYCAKGCFFHNLGDGTCDLACNVEECNFDYGDCGCAVGCSFKYSSSDGQFSGKESDKCSSYCLVLSCHFGASFCDNQSLVMQAVLNYVVYGDKSKLLDTTTCDCQLTDYFIYNKAKCPPVMIDGFGCSQKECFYCMGTTPNVNSACVRASFDSCLICSTNMILNWCETKMNECPIGYSDVIGLVGFFGITHWCLPKPVSYSPSNYELVYVNSTLKEAGVGTKDSPFRSLYRALVNVFASFTKILIESQENQLFVDDSTSVLVADKFNPLVTKSPETFYELWIIGTASNGGMVNVYYKSIVFFTPSAQKVFIQNVRFVGTKTIKVECDDDLCAYCPLYTQYSQYKYNDRGQLIEDEDFAKFSTNCSNYFNYNYFVFTTDVEITNVEFYNFRSQYNSFIKSSGKLTLNQVSFKKMQAKPTGSILLITCIKDCINTIFTYNSGSVQDLGAGYDDSENVQTGSFLKALEIGSVALKNVNFLQNFMLNNLRASSPGSLINIYNHLGTVEVSDCSFSLNYVNFLIFIDVSTLEYSNIIIEDGVSKSYSQQHLLLRNLKIENCYCSNGLFFYSMQKVLHNVRVSDLDVSGSVVGGSGFFYIKSSGSVTKTDKAGTYQTKVIKGEKVAFYIPARYLEIRNVTINDSVTGGHAIFIDVYSNCDLYDIRIEGIVDGTVGSIQRIINQFVTWPGWIDEENEKPDLNCDDLLTVSNVHRLFLNGANISQSACFGDSASPGIVLNSITFVDIQELFLSDLSSSTATGVALDIQNSQDIMIKNLSLINLENSQYSIVQFDFCSSVSIDRFSALILNSSFSSPLVVSRVISFQIVDFEFSGLSTEFSNGGCFSFLTSAVGSSVEFQDGLFEDCITNNGKGGGIYLDGMSTKSTCELKARSLTFKGCKAKEGAVLYISSMNTFDESSDNVLEKIVVKNCVSSQGGIIADYHNAGLLQLKDLSMDQNLGNNAGYMAYYSSNSPRLRIENADFLNSDSIDPVLSFRSLVNLTRVDLRTVKIIGTKSAVASIYTSKISLTATSLTLKNVYSGLDLTSESQMTASELILNNCGSTGVSVTYSSSFNCEKSEFRKNTDTLLFVDKDSQVNITTSIISENLIKFKPLLSFSSSLTGMNSISNTKIKDNSITSNCLFFVSQTNLDLFNVTISSNSITNYDYSGIYSFKSVLSVNESTFADMESSNQGTFIYSISSSTLQLFKSTFKDGSSAQGNIYVKDSVSTIISCNFLNNSGGDLYLETANLTMTESVVKNSGFGSKDDWGSFVLVDAIDVKIVKSSFLNPSERSSKSMQSLIYLDTCQSFFIDGCLFRGSEALSMAVFLKGTQKAVVKNTVFELFKSSPFSALTAISTENGHSLNIENSHFFNNTSTENGGAIYADSYNLTITNCQISDNFANSSGGGVFYKTSECSKCGMFLFGSTSIVENSCNMDGGGVKWNDFKPVFNSSEVIIQNNSAKYGKNLASRPSFLSFDQFRSLSIPMHTLLEVAPGQEFKADLIIYIKDTYGQVVSTDNSTTLTISANTTEGVFSVSGTTSFISESGSIIISNFTPSGPPGSSMILKLESTIDEKVTRNDLVVHQNTAFLNISFRDCEPGEQIETASCSRCPDNKYLLKAASNCKTCPTGATCQGGSSLIVNDGYWRSSLSSEVLYSCEHPAACLKGNSENPLGTCSKGYTGVKCQSCQLGYSMNSDYQCARCPGKAANVGILIGLAIGIITLAVILVKTTLKSAFTPKAMYSIYIKIFTNYLQLVFITTQFNLQWPSYVKQLFRVQQGAASVSDQIFSVDCYLDEHNPDNRTQGYYLKICFMAGMPVGIFLVSYVVWIFHCFTFSSYHPLKREVYTTIIVLFFLVYPNIVKILFGHFNCFDVDQMDSYLKTNAEITCWSEKHRKYGFIVVVPGIILWVVGFPALLLTIMTKNKKFLHLDTYRVVFGYLFNGYKLSRFYWEFVIMYRKILLISISVFLSSQAFIIQALTVVVVLVPSLYMQYQNRPYNSDELNHMETEALFTATITIYCGLYYLSNSISEELKLALFLVIVFGNAYFVLYWVFYVFQALFDMFIKIFPHFREKFKKGDAFEENFTEETLVQEGVFHDRLEGRKSYTFLKLRKKQIKQKIEFWNMHQVYNSVVHDEVKDFINGNCPY